MASRIVERILERINRPDLLSILASDLSASELNTLLLEVFRERAKKISPAQLLRQYKENRFVQPADLPVLETRRMETDILGILEAHSFQLVDLSPLAIQGTCSVVGPVDQHKVVSATRGTEVLADSTNALALYACARKTEEALLHSPSGIWMRCAAVQRQVRAQPLTGKGFRAHFRIGCMATCGRDTGHFTFEKNSLLEHLQVMRSIFLDYFHAGDITFRLMRRQGNPGEEHLLTELETFLRRNSNLQLTIIDDDTGNTYYKGLQFKADIRINGTVYEIGDGGFVAWTAQLLGNKKERMLSSGFGFDLMHRIIHGTL